MRHWFDDDDILAWVLLSDGVRRRWVIALLLVVVAAVCLLAWRDSRECAHRACTAGQHPIVASGECVCVSEAR
jgi:hypothetical protein